MSHLHAPDPSPEPRILSPAEEAMPIVPNSQPNVASNTPACTPACRPSTRPLLLREYAQHGLFIGSTLCRSVDIIAMTFLVLTVPEFFSSTLRF